MSTNNFPKETEIRLTEFFTNIIDPKDMAKAIRQINYMLALSALRECKTLPEKISIENSFYCMNRLAEALDPYLDID